MNLDGRCLVRADLKYLTLAGCGWHLVRTNAGRSPATSLQSQDGGVGVLRRWAAGGDSVCQPVQGQQAPAEH